MSSFNVEIYDDEELELPEEFYIDLRITPEAESRGVRLASPDTATVVIKDDDSETTVFLKIWAVICSALGMISFMIFIHCSGGGNLLRFTVICSTAPIRFCFHVIFYIRTYVHQ